MSEQNVNGMLLVYAPIIFILKFNSCSLFMFVSALPNIFNKTFQNFGGLSFQYDSFNIIKS